MQSFEGGGERLHLFNKRYRFLYIEALLQRRYCMIRPLLILWLIFFSLRYRTRPWNFFQLNNGYFSLAKNIFSKLELDDQVPDKWRLHQVIDDGYVVPDFPVFIKPEWGQNSYGVSIARNQTELDLNRRERSGKSTTFLLQQAAPEKREFEFFYIRSVDDMETCAVVSLTETVNDSGETLVVNGIRNSNSHYIDLTEQVTKSRLAEFWQMIRTIGCYRIARVGMRADSLEQLLEGRFHVMEINIFLPMPLMLLDGKIGFKEKHLFIKHSMKAAARLGATCIKQEESRSPIFYRKLIAHYKVKE